VRCETLLCPTQEADIWCNFIKDGRTVGVRELSGLSDEEAIEKVKLLFEESRGAYDTIEVWNRDGMIYPHARRNTKSETKIAVWP
jgi:hypothetical protein